jgi:hypothetical protein
MIGGKTHSHRDLDNFPCSRRGSDRRNPGRPLCRRSACGRNNFPDERLRCARTNGGNPERSKSRSGTVSSNADEYEISSFSAADYCGSAEVVEFDPNLLQLGREACPVQRRDQEQAGAGATRAQEAPRPCCKDGWLQRILCTVAEACPGRNHRADGARNNLRLILLLHSQARSTGSGRDNL